MARGETGATKDRILIFMNSWPKVTPIPLNRIVENLDARANNISQRLADLQQEGYVGRRDDNLGGGWELTERGKLRAQQLEERNGKWLHPVITESRRLSPPRTTNLRHVGGVRAGDAELFENDPDVRFECGFDADTHVAMTVLSDSMEHRRIYQGDTIIVELVRPSQQIPPGAIAVMRVPVGTSIVGEDVDQNIKDAALRGANPDFPPLDGI
ncbi:MAG: S24 family peptidase [Roseiflexaceae bacterium]|nr:S24 family peptidase [Roseiflexaceae bacterium]